MKKIILESELTCPECHFKELLEMPTNACQWFYECTNCHTLLKPDQGDCCVFCSFATVPCPPIQLHGKSESGKGCCGAS